MMDNFIDLIKSSKQLLMKCMELCDSLETDFVSEELTNDTKDERLNIMIEGFKEATKKVTVAKTKSIKKHSKLSNGIQKLKGNSTKLNNINSKSNSNQINNDQEEINDHLSAEKGGNIINCDIASTEEIKDTCKYNSSDNDDNLVVSDVVYKDAEITYNANISNDCDINKDITESIDSDSAIIESIDNIKQCSIVLEDIIKADFKTVSDKDYFKDLEAEVNKLSQLPKFKSKSYASNDRDEVKSKKLSKVKASSKVLESDSGDSGTESENNSDGSVDIDLGNTELIDSPLSISESEESSDDSIKNVKSSVSNNKVRFSENLLSRRVTRSLKIPPMSDSETSNRTGVSNDILQNKRKKDSKTSDKSLASISSEDESDASASNLRIKNSNKRKIVHKTSKSSKKQKIDEDEAQEDSDDVIEKRKNIRKIMTKSKLSEATKEAEQLEIERRKRMEEKQQIYNNSLTNKGATSIEGLSSLILEKDQNGEPIVGVHSHIVEKLKPHQVEAVHFMYECVIENVQCLLKSQEEKGEDNSSSVGGCILAHCMGLGKTLSLIAFMHTMLTTPILNLYSCVIVCPVNTALNWKKEWEMWMPVDRPVQIFEICSNETKKFKIAIVQKWSKKGGVLIIGYEMFRLLTASDSRTTRNKAVRQKLQEALVDPGADFIVCDEGHLLKNEKSAISKIINKVKTRCRIVLTGTPLQNRLVEYHTMVNFVKPNLLGTQKEFLNRFVNPISNGQHINSTPYDVKIMKKRSHILYKTLDGCVHRRDYSALVKYLPPKYEYIIKIRMSDIQIQLYKAYLANNRILKQSLFQDQTTLARIWTHPFLICMHQEIQDKKMFLAESDEESFIEDSNDNSSEIEKMKSKKVQDDKGVVNLISSDSDDNHDKFDKMEVDKNDEDSNSSLDEVVKKWSTSTRRGTRSCFRDSDDEEGKPKLNFELENLKETIVADKHWWSDIISPENEHQIEVSGKLTILFQILRKAEDMGDKVIVFSHSLLVLDIIEKYLLQLHTIAEKVKDDLVKLNASVSKEGLVDINEANKASNLFPEIGNVSVSEEGLVDINQANKSTNFFPEIGYNTWEKGIDYDRMDGSTLVYTRADIQSRFNSEKDRRLRLFLISTRAGGMGVNLVAANRVVIFDVSWNPSNDIQAIFRSYRFGQNKPVYVYRLVSQGTMEEKMYERQVTKQSLSLRVVDEQQIGRYFTEEDLKSLYKFEPDIYDAEKERETPILPKDRFLAELIQEFPHWIFGYHEHDSLLQNKEDEELTETERQEAWKEFEDEKLHGSRPMNNHPIQISFDPNHFAQVQMSQMQQQFPQYAAIYAQNYMNLLRYALGQQPDLKFNPSELGARMNNIFFMSLQKYNNNIAASATVASAAPIGSTHNVPIAPSSSIETPSQMNK